MRHLDLFSGIGGFALAARWLGWETVGFCEIDDFCRAVLRKHWPGVPIVRDIRYLAEHCEPLRGGADIITGGFPCQPFSLAGKRRGKDDDRYLWPAMLEVISKVRPRWVCGENVAGLDGMALDCVLSDLESEGYEVCEPFIIPACAVDAWHRRDRYWLVAHHDGKRQSKLQGSVANERRRTANSRGANGSNAHYDLFRYSEDEAVGLVSAQAGQYALDDADGRNAASHADCLGGSPGPSGQRDVLPNRNGHGSASEQSGEQFIRGADTNHLSERGEGGWTQAVCVQPGVQGSESVREVTGLRERSYLFEPKLCRSLHGVPAGMDVGGGKDRLHALGNAVVPAVAYMVLKAIADADTATEPAQI